MLMLFRLCLILPPPLRCFLRAMLPLMPDAFFDAACCLRAALPLTPIDADAAMLSPPPLDISPLRHAFAMPLMLAYFSPLLDVISLFTPLPPLLIRRHYFDADDFAPAAVFRYYLPYYAIAAVRHMPLPLPPIFRLLRC